MRNYEESKSERVNRVTAIFLTAAIYFVLFTGLFFANHPEQLPDTVKEWLKIENPENQMDQKKELPLKTEKKDRA